MTTTAPPAPRAPMSPERKATLAAGLFYIATFVFSIPAAFGLYDDVLDHASAFVLGAGSETPVLWGAFFEMLTALTGIGTAVALYPFIRRHGPVGSIGFVASRTLEASIIVLGVVNVLAIVTLRQDATGGDTAALTTSAQSMLAMKDWTFLFGPGFIPVINALCLAPILYRARLVPRIIPTLGLIGAPLLFASSTGTLFGLHDQVSTTASVLVIPIFFWELSLGLWMTFKGFTAGSATPAAALRSADTPTLVGAPT